MTLTLLDSSLNIWAGNGASYITEGAGSGVGVAGFSSTLTGTLFKLKIYSAGGSNFSSGSFNIAYI
jgi:hypothetical protein